jgi:hypothetical protein
LTVDPVDTLSDMPRSSTQPPLVAERPEMSDLERAKRLAELAELIVDPTWLDREVLKELEKREDEPR